MDNNDLKQDFFISDEGYVNIRLKIITDCKIEREKIIKDLMGKVYNSKGLELSENTIVDQLYFHNQNPTTVLNQLKKQLIDDLETIFDKALQK